MAVTRGGGLQTGTMAFDIANGGRGKPCVCGHESADVLMAPFGHVLILRWSRLGPYLMHRGSGAVDVCSRQ